MIRRRTVISGIMGSSLAHAAGLWLPAAGRAATSEEPPSDITASGDFDELWNTIGARYCFFGEKKTDWDQVRTLYRPQALAATTIDEFTRVVHGVLGELYDAHTHLSNPPAGLRRWPLYDLMMEQRGDIAMVVAVEPGSAAETAGIGAGAQVIAVNGQPIGPLVQSLMPRCLTAPDPAAAAYALNVAVAGLTRQPRSLVIRTARGSPRTVDLPLSTIPSPPDVEWRVLDGALGYVAIRSFGDEAVTESFNQALLALRDTRGLIIDVRGNGGGDTAVARPIMGRFITERRAYARMRRRADSDDRTQLTPAWTEYVDPAGPFTYSNPVVALTNHWSASMAEGFPMGMRGIGRATIVGSRMMELGAAVFSLRLDRTGVDAQYSAEPVYDVQDQPRWHMKPDVEVAPGGDILTEGIRVLNRLLPARRPR